MTRRRNTGARSRRGGGRKSSSRLGILALIALAAIVAVLSLPGHSEGGRSYRPDADMVSELMTVGMPDSIPSREVDYKGFRLSFNSRYHIPNWVAWELTADETEGTAKRHDKFSADLSVAGCAETYDYLYSGYDRGHMAPAADMKWDGEAMKESFYLTNICPQANELNTGAWRTLEEKCRQWAKADSSLVIIAGPVLDPAPYEYIGDNRVGVPRSFFKVILAPYARPVRAIAFVMPNSRVKGGMQAAATSVDMVEQLTGYDFFQALPDSIEDIVEAQNDFPLWSTIKPSQK